MTRYYRAPEVILLQKNYNDKADLWSVGCILGELILSSSRYNKVGMNDREKMLFRGKSCYPLSPEGRDKAGSNDQLVNIVKVLGHQTRDDTSFLVESKIRRYFDGLNIDLPKVQFDKEFMKSSPELIQIMESLL